MRQWMWPTFPLADKLCATFSANVNINYRLPIKVCYRICTLRHIRIEIIHGSKNVHTQRNPEGVTWPLPVALVLVLLYYILYYYYRKKKTRGGTGHAQNILPVTSGQGHFQSGPLPVTWPRSTSTSAALSVLIYNVLLTHPCIHHTLWLGHLYKVSTG